MQSQQVLVKAWTKQDGEGKSPLKTLPGMDVTGEKVTEFSSFEAKTGGSNSEDIASMSLCLILCPPPPTSVLSSFLPLCF